eukprot:TRINITY_DN4194_c1_g1_i1.p2 TRINITY_DN4194_c1_g1~~TRINITY_DN4194_c1_g1_i1.p2  ORF type:complete len:118 (-),score=24.10 TRINITY_DN4194_c1_g1_i1:427-780(-)
MIKMKLNMIAIQTHLGSFARHNLFHYPKNNIKINHVFSRFFSTEEKQPPTVPTNCCGTGCRNCVWDTYFIEVNEYNEWKKQQIDSGKMAPSENDNLDSASIDMFAQMEREMEKQRNS